MQQAGQCLQMLSRTHQKQAYILTAAPTAHASANVQQNVATQLAQICSICQQGCTVLVYKQEDLTFVNGKNTEP